MPKRNVCKGTAPVSIHDIFPFVNKKTAYNLANWTKLSHPFKYDTVTDQTMSIIFEKLSNPYIFTIVLGVQKNGLQGEGLHSEFNPVKVGVTQWTWLTSTSSFLPESFWSVLQAVPLATASAFPLPEFEHVKITVIILPDNTKLLIVLLLFFFCASV